MSMILCDLKPTIMQAYLSSLFFVLENSSIHIASSSPRFTLGQNLSNNVITSVIERLYF